MGRESRVRALGSTWRRQQAGARRPAQALRPSSRRLPNPNTQPKDPPEMPAPRPVRLQGVENRAASAPGSLNAGESGLLASTRSSITGSASLAFDFALALGILSGAVCGAALW